MIGYILLFLFGLFLLISPGVWWSITEQWKSSDAIEPSKLFIWSTRFGGAMCTTVLFVRFEVITDSSPTILPLVLPEYGVDKAFRSITTIPLPPRKPFQ
jgi:hypothetical protein